MERESPFDEWTIEEFNAQWKEDPETGCWEWTGTKYTRGYGLFKVEEEKKPRRAHRYSAELHHGEIPKGMVVMHLCDNVGCVNPEHLRIGTQKENIHDAMKKGRWMTEKRKEFLRNAPQNFRFGQPGEKDSH